MKNLLSKLENHNIQISLNGDNLDVSFDGQEIDQNLLNEIRTHKSELIDDLKKYAHFNINGHIKPLDKDSSYQLSDTQRRLWVLCQFENASNAYNMPTRIFLEGKYDPSKFGLAIAAVLERHEILRTIFKKDENEEIRQWIQPLEDLNFQLDHKDFTNEDSPIAKAENYIAEDSFRAFDLEKGPLVRASLLQVAANSYIFYYNMHHIISDGWSMEILGRDVMSYYNFYQNDAPLNLPELKIQYKDYAAWQITQIDNDVLGTSKNYWSERFKGDLPTTTLPNQKKRPRIKTFNGHRLSTQIPFELTHGLRNFSQEAGGSLFMGLLSVWKVLMYRYTSQEDLIVGTAVAGRNHTDLEDQIGFYVNTIAFRNNIIPEDTFNQTFARIKTSTLEAYNHQMYPFDRLVEDLNVVRDSSRSPIFEVMFTIQNLGDRQAKKQFEISDAIRDLGESKSKFDLEVCFEELGEHLSFGITYNSDVYEKTMISQLILHFKSLLKELLKHPNQKISAIDYLSPIEKDILLIDFNNTGINYPKQQTVLDLFEEQVLANPEKIAVSYEQEKLSYRELEEKSRQLAQYFIDNGIKKQLVPICVDRSLEMVIGILGILRSGNGYVPVEGSFPQERIQYILEDVQSEYVVTNSLFISLFDTVKTVNLDTFEYNLKNTAAIDIKIAPTDLAYCIYTSGTTGVPKGVINEHGGLLNRLLWMQNDLQINPDSVLLHKTPYVFDVSVWELIMPFIAGAQLVIAKPDGHKDPEYLLDIIEGEAITIVHFVPSMFGMFLEYAVDEKCKNLSHIICSGEALPIQMVQRFKEIFKKVKLHNYYGPTEAAIDVTAIDLTESDLQKDTVSIGKPVVNTKIYIVDKSLNLQPMGAVGELLIGGIQVARGYLNKAELTAEKFIESPFIKGDRLYKTGDLARWLPDGTIDYIGRKDNQVKIKGHRIELGEIEHALSNYEGISNSIIVIRERNENKYLVAYYIAKEEQDALDLRNFLQSKLPLYMVPEYFMYLKEFPLTVNGKLDVKSLPDVEVRGGNNYVAPSSELEEQLVEIWANVLKLDKVVISVNRNFFELGGNSMDIIILNNKINLDFNCSISVTEMFGLSTILEMKEFILTSGNKQFDQIQDNIEHAINDATENLRLLDNF